MSMNLLQMQDALKNMSDAQVSQQLKSPTGQVPQFLLLAELSRRARTRSDAERQQAAQREPAQTVKDEAVNAAGVPQAPLPEIARAMAPRSAVAQNAGVARMARGGPVRRMAKGDLVTYQGMQMLDNGDGSYVNPATGELYWPWQATQPVPPASGAAGNPRPTTQVDPRAAGLLADPLSALGSTPTIYGEGTAAAGAGVQGAQPTAPATPTTPRFGLGLFPIPAPTTPAVPTTTPAAPAATTPAMPTTTPAAPAVTTPAAPTTTPAMPTTTAPSTQRNSAAPGSYEQALIDALAEIDKRAEQDKWLAVAMAGLQTLGAQTGSNPWAAIGQGNAAGLSMYMSSRDQAAKDKLDIQGQLEQWRQQQRAMQMASAAGSAGVAGVVDVTGGLTPAQYISELNNQAADITAELAMLPTDDKGNPVTQVAERYQQLTDALKEIKRRKAELVPGLAGLDVTAPTSSSVLMDPIVVPSTPLR